MLPFGLESAFFVFAFFQIGVIINQRGLTTQIAITGKNKAVMVAIIIALFVAIGFISAYNGFAQVKALAFGRSIFCLIATSILGIIAVVIFSMLAENTRWLQYIGQNTLPILLMHKFPILFFQMIIKPVGRLLEQGDSAAGVVCAVIVGAITVALCLIVNMIIERVFPIAVGKERKA